MMKPLSTKDMGLIFLVAIACIIVTVISQSKFLLNTLLILMFLLLGYSLTAILYPKEGFRNILKKPVLILELGAVFTLIIAILVKYILLEVDLRFLAIGMSVFAMIFSLGGIISRYKYSKGHNEGIYYTNEDIQQAVNNNKNKGRNFKSGLKKVLAVFLILLAAVAAFIVYEYEQPGETSMMKGSHNILLLCDDPTEDQGTAGIGSVDMAFVINLVDGNVKNTTAIYPGGMRHPTATEPSSLGTGKLLLHDSLYGVSTEEGAQRAQEIVEYNKGIKTDAVVMITPDAVNALVSAAGPIYVDGYGYVTNDSINFIRGEQNNGGMTRGVAVESVMKPIIDSAESNPVTFLKLANVAMDQYNKGYIRVVPSDLVAQFAIAKGLKV
jgi:hypothetical protein